MTVHEELAALNKRQNEYLLHVVQDNMKAECLRQKKLDKTKSSSQRKQLEKKFNQERYKEKERITRLREEQRIIARTKAESLLQNSKKTEKAGNSYNHQNNTLGFGSGASRDEEANAAVTAKPLKKASNTKTSKRIRKPSNRLAPLPEGRTSFPNQQSDLLSNMSFKMAPSSKTRLLAGTVQQSEFYRKMYDKTDKSVRSDILSERNLRIHEDRSVRSLLREKHSLLNQLNGVAQLQQQMRYIDDDASTVRSSVSSFKSSDFRSTASERSYQYVPFKD